MTKDFDWSDVAAQLQETRDLLDEVEQRFHHLQGNLTKKQDLLAQQEQTRSQLNEIQKITELESSSKIRRKPTAKPLNNDEHNIHKDQLLKQLEDIGERLEQIEVELESRLISWSSFREPFWQVVRFVSLGIVIGVILKSCAD
ncbi:MAG: DUF2203 domain-containing protein [Pseudanabaena sp.]|nr:MAG: DUF2203 domain-containing protein [Pseudanabaena sp.]